MTAISSKAFSIAALITALLALFFSSTEARSCGSLLSPRSYQYSRNRDSFDVVSEMLRVPVYFNSLMKQQQEQSALLARSTPRYVVSEDNSSVQLEVEVPGVSAKDLEVELEDDNILRIKGNRKHKVAVGSFTEAEFDLSFQLNDGVEPSQMKVSLSAGILRVQVPKKIKVTKRLDIATDVEDEQLKVKAIQTSADGRDAAQTGIEEVDGITIIEGDEP